MPQGFHVRDLDGNAEREQETTMNYFLRDDPYLKVCSVGLSVIVEWRMRRDLSQLVSARHNRASTHEETMTMGTLLNPYLNFRDNAREAMDFYQSVFGGELTRNTFADYHASEDPAEQDKIMHSQLVTESGLTLMAADTPNSMDYTPATTFSISLSGDDDAELRGYWAKLSDGGTITMPLNAAPWGDTFGMCVDKFGVSWWVNISGAQPS
jgi:PhnB protein